MIEQLINFDDVTKEKTKEHNPNWSKTPDHLVKTLIIAGPGL